MKKAFSVFFALLSLCLLVTAAFAADDSPEVFSFEVVIQEGRPSGPVPNRRNEYPSAFSAEEPDESPNIPESPESPALPAPDEDEQSSWISGYLRTPGGFEYPEIDAKAFADEIFRLANEERVKAGLPEVERREDIAPVTVIRAQELSEFFSRTRPNGEGYMSLMDEYGIEYRWARWSIAARCLSIDKAIQRPLRERSS